MPARPCIAPRDDGQPCGRETDDTTRLCPAHRGQYQRLVQAELLHCHGCLLMVKGPSGAPDREATLARCPVAFSFAPKGQPTGNSPCYFEVQEVFAPLDQKEDFVVAMEATVRAEGRLVRRGMRLVTAMGGALPNELLRAAEQHVRHLESLATFAGVYRPPPRVGMTLPVPKDQQAELLDALMHGGEPVEDRGAPRGLEGDLGEGALAEGDTAVSQAPPRAPPHIKGLMKDEA